MFPLPITQSCGLHSSCKGRGKCGPGCVWKGNTGSGPTALFMAQPAYFLNSVSGPELNKGRWILVRTEQDFVVIKHINMGLTEAVLFSLQTLNFPSNNRGGCSRSVGMNPRSGGGDCILDFPWKTSNGIAGMTVETIEAKKKHAYKTSVFVMDSLN